MYKTFRSVPPTSFVNYESISCVEMTMCRYRSRSETFSCQLFAAAGDLSKLEDERFTSTLQRKRVLQMKHYIVDKRFLLRKAILNGNLAGVAVWIISLGKREPHTLKNYLRVQSLQEKEIQVWLRFVMYARNRLPDLVWGWMWPSSELERSLQERYAAASGNRREVQARWSMNSPEEDCFVLNSLVVLPKFERRGIGRTLLQEGIDMADRTGAPIYLTSSPAGKRLYEKYGIEILEEYEVGEKDLLEWTETVMRYDPRRRQQPWSISASERDVCQEG